MIIGRLVSLPSRRLAATLWAALGLLCSSPVVLAGALPDSTWTALTPLPRQAGAAVFALAVDPNNNQVVLAGTSSGALFRSTDGGSTWSAVSSAGSQITTLAFSPFKAGLVLAGTQSSGALGSVDGGATWAPATGVEGRSVRAFGFALTLFVAGTDRGVYLSQDGQAWTASGLTNVSIDAVAVEAIHPPARLVAGGAAVGQSPSFTLYQSTDSGSTWTPFNPSVSGTIAIKMVAPSGPLPPNVGTRPLLVGTNAGLFASNDNASTFTPLSGGELLPSIDYTQAAFISNHFDRFYAASDGGGSGSGGLWRTDDAGSSFRSLNPPIPSITALAVSSDESPTLYVATFSPSDHLAELWAYHDTGGLPQGPVLSPAPPVSAARTGASTAGTDVLQLIKSPQFPYIALGVVALMVLVGAGVAHVRGRRH